MPPMFILLTNDDGIQAPGIVAAYRAVTELMPDATIEVVAPETVQSATGHGITITAPLLTSRVTIENAFTGTAVDGRPADCVKLAVNQLLLRKPDLVISGLNSGANTGINVIYSGTVAAAIEAAFLGLPSVALSLYTRHDVPTDYLNAARHAVKVVRQMLAASSIAAGECVSINVPALRSGESPKGTRVVRQCTRPWADTYERRADPRGRDYYWNSSVFTLGETEDDTDVAGIRDGYLTVTPLQFDLTAHARLSKLTAALG
jgi:5'-nucleotidase